VPKLTFAFSTAAATAAETAAPSLGSRGAARAKTPAVTVNEVLIFVNKAEASSQVGE